MPKKLTPLKAIRAKCLDCMNGQIKLVEECWDKNCPLYEHRIPSQTPQNARRAIFRPK